MEGCMKDRSSLLQTQCAPVVFGTACACSRVRSRPCRGGARTPASRELALCWVVHSLQSPHRTYAQHAHVHVHVVHAHVGFLHVVHDRVSCVWSLRWLGRCFFGTTDQGVQHTVCHVPCVRPQRPALMSTEEL